MAADVPVLGLGMLVSWKLSEGLLVPEGVHMDVVTYGPGTSVS